MTIRTAKLAALASLAFVPIDIAGDQECVTCVGLVQCITWGGALFPSWQFWCSVDHDTPQACSTWLKQKWSCVEGGYGWKIKEEYRLGFTCTSGDCF